MAIGHVAHADRLPRTHLPQGPLLTLAEVVTGYGVTYGVIAIGYGVIYRVVYGVISIAYGVIGVTNGDLVGEAVAPTAALDDVAWAALDSRLLLQQIRRPPAELTDRTGHAVLPSRAVHSLHRQDHRA